jgi:hypothetical protein
MKADAFTVRTNMKWKVVPSEGTTYDWVHPFPDNGEKDGQFIFKTTRNVDQKNTRDAYFNVMVDKGKGWETLDGMIVIHQELSADFLEMSAAMFEKEAVEGTCKLSVFSNVAWTYTLEPMADYATSDVSWITDESAHETAKTVDTLVLKLAENAGGVRGANINISYTLDGTEHTDVIPVTQYGATEVSLDGFPVEWTVGDLTNCNFSASFPSGGTIASTSATGGTISFVEASGNSNENFGMSVGSTGEPYVTGTWPGDYWEFKSDSPISAGTIVKIQFSTRVSSTGYKYWRLEYRDGDDWKPVGKTYTTTYNGSDVLYTHTMAAGGSVNTQVSGIFKVEKTTDAADIRFVVVSNETCKGDFNSAPTGNTARLSNRSADDLDVNPVISIVAAGTESMVAANITVTGVTNKLMTFEGTPDADKEFTVNSDNDFTVTSTASWLTVTPDSGLAEDTETIKVTCQPSTLATLRTGQINIKSGITTYSIQVVQSAAGGELDPLISIVNGNRKSISTNGGSYTVNVQSNVAVSYKTDVDWISASPAPATKSLVDVNDYNYTVSKNTTGKTREGHVTFYNDTYGIESVLTVTQDWMTTYFTDDFTWVKPYAETGSAGDAVGTNDPSAKAPNVYTYDPDSAFVKAFRTKGYVDLNPTPKVMYLQDAYLKFGKTSYNTGIQLPPCDFEGTDAVDVEIQFDWCAQIKTTGPVDPTVLYVYVSGAGTCSDTGSDISNGFSSTQTTGNLAWQHVSLVINNVTSDTRIAIRPESLSYLKSRVNRWYLDNVKITAAAK